MYKSYDFECPKCPHKFDDLIKPGEPNPPCPTCKGPTEIVVSAHRLFTTIVPDYPGAKKLKAGYQHKYVNRPREKIGVSVPSKIGK